jgi:hypothetical protein
MPSALQAHLDEGAWHIILMTWLWDICYKPALIKVSIAAVG